MFIRKYQVFFNGGSKMKKLLFLLFGVVFALAGCADESGSNGGGEF